MIPPAQQQQISTEMEHDAEVMSNSQPQQQITDEPKAVQTEVLDINNHAWNPSLQIALLIPTLASLLGLANSFRMLRLPEYHPGRRHRRGRPRLIVSGEQAAPRGMNRPRRDRPACPLRLP